MGKELAEKAVAELAFEIDEEIITFLAEMGRKATNQVAEAVISILACENLKRRNEYVET